MSRHHGTLFVWANLSNFFNLLCRNSCIKNKNINRQIRSKHAKKSKQAKQVIKVQLTTSKFPGATIRLSITLLIFVTRDKMEDCKVNWKMFLSLYLKNLRTPIKVLYVNNRKQTLTAHCAILWSAIKKHTSPDFPCVFDWRDLQTWLAVSDIKIKCTSPYLKKKIINLYYSYYVGCLIV